ACVLAAALPVPDSAEKACDSDSTATSWTPESSNARRSCSAPRGSDQHRRVASSWWFSSANNRLVPTTVSVSFPIGLPAKSITDSSITSAPAAPDPTSARRARGPVTATPKTTSIAPLLRLAARDQHVPASLHCDTVGGNSHSGDNVADSEESHGLSDCRAA